MEPTLFSESNEQKRRSMSPLAFRMRPRDLASYVGQKQAVGEGTWLRRAIERDALSSIILYGPAGTGKTTLAEIIAATTKAQFVELSALSSTVKDLRLAIEEARSRLLSYAERTIVFIDEIHRFTTSQQDALLHAVEDRTIILIGATTENPYFEVNSALLSRSRVIELVSLSDEEISQVLDRALIASEGLNGLFTLADDARQAITISSGGDARAALTTLELAAQMADTSTINLSDVQDATPTHGLRYDRAGDMHYDSISAFIKSMRGSDPNAALYWLARMIDAGEDPKYIARRMFVCASEDVGNADPRAISVASAAFHAAEVIGYPECRINLAQAALYIALAPKSNAAEMGIDAALRAVRTGPYYPVPSHLRDRHRPGSEQYGTYQYPHDYEDGWVSQHYLPPELADAGFYRPSIRGWEALRQQRMDEIKGKQIQGNCSQSNHSHRSVKRL